MGILVISMLLGNINNGNFAGGTHTLAHATQRVILENGGKVFTRHPVQKIIVENGVAKGIRLEDGTEVEAKKAVLSGVDPYHLCVELVGEPHLSSDLIRRIKNLERDWSCITWYTWALQEKPRYLAEQFDPDIGNCKWIYLASSKETGMQDLLDEANERLLRHWPKSAHVVAEDNSYIPGTAPPGKASILTETYVLPAHSGSDQEWKQREKDLAEMVISQWNKYAPNINWDNVIGYVPVTPYFTAQFSKTYGPLVGCNNVLDPTPVQSGRFRPLLELSSGRMPVKNLYATGAGWHPHCGAMGFQGYNIYKVMAEDFGLSKPWEEKGRPY
jgi:phytoene dehydrogenase-like protein